MSFEYMAGCCRAPTADAGYTIADPIWRGTGNDKGYFAFYAGSGWGGYVISKDFTFSLKVDSDTFAPTYSAINGQMYWKGTRGNIYQSRVYGWVYSSYSYFAGYEPTETSTYDSSSKSYKYDGDYFYTFSSLPNSETKEVTLTGRGKYNGTTKTLTAYWERWTSKKEFGEYAAAGGASGTKYLGVPRFKGSNGVYYIRSAKRSGSYFKYGEISYSLSKWKWLIGDYGSAKGWHESSSEPSTTGTVTFTFTKNEGSDVEGSDITVSFVDYVKGPDTSTVYLGEVAIWR